MQDVIDNELREVFKEAIMESLEEKKGFMKRILKEISEDIALGKAIEEGKKTPKISREEVFKTLER
jgi:hypothetical protein